jgi:hypothetical protein
VPDDDYTPAELARAVQRIEAGVDEIRSEVRAQAQVYATKEYVAEVKDSLGREIRDIKVDMQSRRTSWPSIASAIVAIAALAYAVVQAIPPS